VIYDGEISNFGNIDPGGGTDEAGVYLGYHTDYTWVLKNEIHHVGADSIAGCHYADDNLMKAEHYFIGDNLLYGNGENGIDLKGVRYAVVSENKIYGPFTREQGWGIVLHYGASPATTVKDAWVIFNEIYHASGGIYTSSVGCDNLNIVGNLLYDIDASYAAESDSLNGLLIYIRGGNGTFRVVDNTFHNYDRGIYIDDIDGNDKAYVHGNIFSERRQSSAYDIEEWTDESKIALDYNQFYQPGGEARFRWGGGDRTIDYMKSTAGECLNCKTGDPLNISPPTNFDLQNPGSPSMNASIEGPANDSAYAAFFNQYGINIRMDFKGRPRPQDSVWDIGAFEPGDEVTVLTPQNLRLGQ
jgi:hypothetical protein